MMEDDSMLVLDASHEMVFNGREGEVTWFHPKVGMMPPENESDPPVAVMCCQSITGSDVFGQIHESVSTDLGATWATPVPIASLGRHDLEAEGWQEGVCDFVPEWHRKSGRLLGIGQSVFYEDGVLARKQRRRNPVYAVRSPNGEWSAARKLECDDPRMTEGFTSGCVQRVTLENGEIILPCAWSPVGREDRAVGTLRCGFDGEEMKILEASEELRNTASRGLLEPTITRLDGRFYMTIRAEDDRGYVSTSDDGLTWAQQQAWTWEDGEPLWMSTTQQRWLTHSLALYLVYTRKAGHNENVIRWRSPLFMAEVDTERLCLIRETEREVFPLVGDAVNDPRGVALLGNFLPVNATVEESWVTVGENLIPVKGKGDALLARIQWTRPNYELAWRTFE
ncbi:MAG: sialidase family protein [bacterium]|nr:sialidase family protein [bacterium]